METVLVDVTVAVALLNVAVATALAFRRVVVARRTERLEWAEEALRPTVLALLEGDEAELAHLDETETVALSRLLRRYSRLLTGSARQRIAQMAATSGLVEHEVAALADRRPWRRAAAAVMLGDLGTPAEAPRLIRALSDSDPDVRNAAARSLGRLGAVEGIPRLARLMASGRIPRALAAETLMSIGPPAAESLVRLFGARESVVRAACAELIGLVGSSRHAAPLAGLLADPDPEVRVKAARSLGRLGAEPAVAELRKALDDPVPWVRAAVARTLAGIGDEESIERFVVMARNDEVDPARAAARALAELDPGRLAAELEADHSPHLAEALDLAGV